MSHQSTRLVFRLSIVILSVVLTLNFGFSTTFRVDPKQSKAQFRVGNFGFLTVEGQFDTFTGEITVDEKNFEKSKFSGVIQATSINTQNTKRDKHLRSQNYFEVEKHPTITFESTSIKGSSKSFKITGNFTLKGITKSLEFEVESFAEKKDHTSVDLVALTKIPRKEFGLNDGATIDKTVRVRLQLHAAK